MLQNDLGVHSECLSVSLLLHDRGRCKVGQSAVVGSSRDVVVALATVFSAPRVLDDPVRNDLLASEDGAPLRLTVADDDHTVVQAARAAHKAGQEVTVRVGDSILVELHHVRVDSDRDRAVCSDVSDHLVLGILWDRSRGGEVHVVVQLNNSLLLLE